jgi:chromosome segregation ATPase
MLFPKDNPTVNTPPAPAPVAQAAPQPLVIHTTSGGGGAKISILFGAVIALVGACVYLFYQINQIQTQLAATRDDLSTEIARMNETSSVTTQTSRKVIDSLKKDVDKYRAQAAQLSGQAKLEAEQHADQLASKLQTMQEEQGKQVAAVTTDLSHVKDTATAATQRIGEVTNEVGVVKTDLSKNKADTEKLIADMKTARGDLGVQSGLIATNGTELAALKALGERNYTDFKISKTKKNSPQKVGDLQVMLEKADPKSNRYTIIVIADDKKVEKKDRSINEPVQFLLSRAMQPYELVVNDIKKDFISGYVAAPKVQTKRN